MALDVGDRRIGLSVARHDVKIATPIRAIDTQASEVWQTLKDLIDEYDVDELVVGLPRGLDGQDTEQTAKIRKFYHDLSKQVDLEMHFQDEALTSQKAEAELKSKKVNYSKGDIDSLAATYILEDYLIGIIK